MERTRITYRIALEDAGLRLRDLAARLAGAAGATAAARGGAPNVNIVPRRRGVGKPGFPTPAPAGR